MKGLKTALVCGDVSLTYDELERRVKQRSDELTRMVPGRCYVFRASQDADFIVTYLACHEAGRVAVPLEKDAPQERFDEVCRLVAESDVPSDVADILFTTGTTGKSKGTMLSHAAIKADAENLIDAQGFCPDTTFVISGPLNHIGSLSKLWPTFMVGGTVVVTDGMKDIDGFFRAMDYPSQKMATFLVPASIRILLQFGAKRLEDYQHKIDFIETGAAPIAQTDMEQLCQLLPHTRLYNTYASTETGIICTYNYNGKSAPAGNAFDGICVAGCLGPAMRHSQVIITAEGKVSCKGATLMTGYVGDAALTATLLRDNTVFTNDVGELDAHGCLRLKGRQGDVINIGGFKVEPSEVEDAAMAFPSVADCICISDVHPVLGTALRLLVVEKEGKTISKRELALFLAQRLEKYKVPQLFRTVPSIRRTYNGKLDRKYYAGNNMTNRAPEV